MSGNTNYVHYDNADDLEQALVIAAADADARNNEEGKNLPEDTAGATSSVRECNPTTSSIRKLETDDEQEQPTKYLRVGEGHAKVVAQHYNTLEEKGLAERSKSRIIYLRNFHNWIKSMLINEYLTKVKDKKKYNEPVRVLDMCCGKGGDLLKWRKGNIAHLICCDIASVSVEHCKARYEDMKHRNHRDRQSGSIYSIEYIAADCTRVRLREKYKDPSIKLDVVSCQFGFHYSFESLPQAECMMRNAAECLQPGGFFIGTMPDANDLIARTRKANSNRFGNDVYQVEFECDTNKPPLFGAKYKFYMDDAVDCPEFLVHFDTFVKLAKKFGLKLAKKEKFYEFFERMKADGRNLLYNMRGLEAYPPFPGTSSLGSAKDDYVHAEEFLKNDKNSRIGTLSKSEWEASCKNFYKFSYGVYNIF